MFRLDKRKIFLLYQYYLLGKVGKSEEKTVKEQERVIWLANCLKKENFLRAKISKNLKENWTFDRLPPLEKALLIFATQELFFGSNPNYGKVIIDQTINFSKVYLEEGKYRYINKNLDLLWQDWLKTKRMNY